MFEFSLENGKRQFKGGLICLIFNILFTVVFLILLVTIKDATGLMIVAIIFGIIIGVLSVLTLLKLIFGIVVYHAERTASRNASDIEKNEANERNISIKELKDKISKEEKTAYDETSNKINLQSNKKRDKQEKISVSKWDYNSNEQSLTVILENGHSYYVPCIDGIFVYKWKDLDWQERTNLFYKKLFNKSILTE